MLSDKKSLLPEGNADEAGGDRGAQHGGEQSAPVPVCGLSRTAGGEPVRQPLEPAGGGDAGAWSHRTGQGGVCDGGEHPALYHGGVGRGQGEPGKLQLRPHRAHSVRDVRGRSDRPVLFRSGDGNGCGLLCAALPRIWLGGGEHSQPQGGPRAGVRLQPRGPGELDGAVRHDNGGLPGESPGETERRSDNHGKGSQRGGT